MAFIDYQFADGHWEKVECSEDFKREYEFMLVQEKALRWKEMKQKERAGLRCSHDLSLEKFCDEGYEPASTAPDPLEELIIREERLENFEKLLAFLTTKQRAAFLLKLKGLSQKQIAAKLKLSLGGVNERLQMCDKNISEFFLRNPKK